MRRRDVLAGAGALGVAAVIWPAIAETDVPVWPPREHLPLWPGGAPGMPTTPPREVVTITGRPGAYRDIEARGTIAPLIGVYRPARPDGRGVLVIPGGGYAYAAMRNEGIDIAARLNAQRMTAFVLQYRLPGGGWRDRANTPLADAQRAMRLIRANAARFAIDAQRVSVTGFSAGGHLAGSLATLSDVRTYEPIDAADRLSARPAAAALIYAVSNVDPGRSHAGSREELLGPTPDPAMQARFAVERNVVGAPPLFLLHTADDDVVPIANSIDTYANALRAGVSAEAHFLPRGGHGFGVRLPANAPAAAWPEWHDRWLADVTRTAA